MNNTIQTYDPRLGQEFETVNFLTKKRFSNLDHGFYVISGLGVDWGGCASVIEEAIAKTGKLGFAAVEPWVPHTGNLLRSLKSLFPVSHELEKSLIAYFQPGTPVIERLMDLRRTHGADASGAWCIGGCLREFDPPGRESLFKGARWNFAHILGQPTNIGCALELAEMHQSTFMVRIFDRFDDWCSREGFLTR